VNCSAGYIIWIILKDPNLGILDYQKV